MHVQDIPKNVNTQLEQLSWTCIVTIKCFVFAPPPLKISLRDIKV